MTGILVFVAIALSLVIALVVIARRPPGSARRSDVDEGAHTRASREGEPRRPGTDP